MLGVGVDDDRARLLVGLVLDDLALILPRQLRQRHGRKLIAGIAHRSIIVGEDASAKIGGAAGKAEAGAERSERLQILSDSSRCRSQGRGPALLRSRFILARTRSAKIKMVQPSRPDRIALPLCGKSATIEAALPGKLFANWTNPAKIDPCQSFRPIPINPLADGRQSDRALLVRRGVQRLFAQMGAAVLPELCLPTGRRADLVALTAKGRDLDHRDQDVGRGFPGRPQMA